MPDPSPPQAEAQPGELSRTILTNAGTMVGICTTLVGLVKILERQAGQTLADEIVGLIALVFLSSAVLSYLAIRNPHRPALNRWLERGADWAFVMGLLAIGGLTLLFAYDQL
ncbi:MAG TPA: hypothetical protein VIL69_00430 [Roseomonas sp.]